MRVLIADDTEDSRVFLTDYLEGVGFEVLSAENGEIALDLVNKNDIDLLVTDILMPELDGYELCRRLKDNPATVGIPVIFYTATYTEDQDIAFGLSIGAACYLIKPSEPDEILRNIKIAMSAMGASVETYADPGLFEKQHAKVVSKKLDKKSAELKKEKESTQALAQKIEMINDIIPALIVQIDLDFKYQYVNATFESWHKVEKKNVIGRHIRELVGEAGFVSVEPYLIKARSGGHVRYEAEISFADGKTRFLDLQYFPERDAKGSVVSINTIVTDITEKNLAIKEKERLQQKMLQGQKLELVGQLTSGIAHDFNNILNIIGGYADLILAYARQKQDVKLERYLVELESASNRGKNIVAQLLAFCRESGQQASMVNVNKAIRDIVKLLIPTIPATVSIELNLQSDDSPIVKVSPVQFDQIIMNLCINAKDAMSQKGKITISVSAVEIKQMTCTSCLTDIGGKYVDVTISDNGCGIDQANIARIFEPFYSTKATGEGTGLGLAMTHGIVHEYSGHIVVDSKSGEGTSVHILLPLQLVGRNAETENRPAREVAK